MRGEETLYLPFFCKEQPEVNEGKGRSGFLIERRDNKLILRYYYHTWLKKKSYEETITRLSFEFDLAERTIQDRLMLNSDTVSEIMKKKPPVFEMKREYPYFTWS